MASTPHDAVQVPMPELVPLRRALLSVSDKTALIPLAQRLSELGVELISTGGTARALAEAGLSVTSVHQVTGFPEIMDGRVKTLHPRIHGGLLARRESAEHVAAMTEHAIEPIDLVCVNLYPFEQTVARPDVADAEAIEQIDIGGPSMIRSAAKNHRYVAVVTDPEQYPELLEALDANQGATPLALRQQLAAAAFARTAAYDAAIAQWMTRQPSESLPARLSLALSRDVTPLRYGENPHQAGALYHDPAAREASVARAKQLHGKALSFCNLFDANGALELVKEIDPQHGAAVSVIKHANPCGFAVADDLPTAFEKAYAGDPLAAFGGILAFNRPVDQSTAQAVVSGQRFLEVIIAPAFEPEALQTLQQAWANVRLLETGPLPSPEQRDPSELDMKRLTGAMLVQQRDLTPLEPATWAHQAGPEPTPEILRDLFVACAAVKHLKSNAVCAARDGGIVGAGAGQMDRLTACKLAVEKAGERAQGASVGSDAFFPFRDGPDQLIAAGVQAIAHPGGSKRDEETIQACQEAGVCLLFTGKRLFRH